MSQQSVLFINNTSPRPIVPVTFQFGVTIHSDIFSTTENGYAVTMTY